MRVRVKEDYVPFVGRRGEIKEIPDAEGRTLVLVGKVEEVVDRVDKPAVKTRDLRAEEPATEAPPVDTETGTKKRRYNRRDMGAEPR